MKKILMMFTMLLICSIAAAQTDSTTVRDKTTKKDKTVVKKSKGTDKSKSQKIYKKERDNGTTGTIMHPDTKGAGTGTGIDTRIGTPPGQPEKMEK